VKLWNLQNVQITLDGTEEVYNRSKAYIYQEGSPYRIVMGNIQRLLDASITVTVRLNLDLHNANNLLELVDELGSRFSGRSGLYVYGYYLFDKENPQALLHSEDGWQKRARAMSRLEEKIAEYGLDMKCRIPKSLKVNHCMADCGHCVTILPTGDIGLCDHYTESEFIGHIDREGFDTKMVESWQEHTMGAAECADCAHYPSCVRLKKCTSTNICFDRFKQEKSLKLQREMLYEYQCWQSHTVPDQIEGSDLC
jgi:radical SAM protein with 4Fe4S-binding SPASM domain